MQLDDAVRERDAWKAKAERTDLLQAEMDAARERIEALRSEREALEASLAAVLLLACCSSVAALLLACRGTRTCFIGTKVPILTQKADRPPVPASDACLLALILLVHKYQHWRRRPTGEQGAPRRGGEHAALSYLCMRP